MTAIDVAGFFDTVWTQVPVAEHAAGSVSECWYEIAERTLKVRFIGPTLSRVIAPALGHLEVGARDHSDLTLHCWDCRSLGLEFPKAPVSLDAFTPRGEVRGLNDGRFHAAYEAGGRLLSLMDVDRREAVYCVGVATEIPRFDVAEPIRAILSWFMRKQGRQLLHAGAVGTADGGVLLIGRSGAGKSMTALGCLAGNLKCASDDFCAVSTTGAPAAYSLYCTGKSREEDWNIHPFLGSLAPDLDPERREKVIYFLNDSVPERLISGFPIKAIVIPRRAGDACTLRPISPAAALRVCAPDTARLLPDAGPEVLRCVARLVRSVPCYELLLGSKPERVRDLIDRFLAGTDPKTGVSPRSGHRDRVKHPALNATSL